MPISQNERDLMAKIADLDRRLQLQERNENQIWKGTAFPTTGLYDRRRFTRSDRDVEYYYDLANTRWLSTELFTSECACRATQPFAAGSTNFFDMSFTSKYTYNGVYIENVQGYWYSATEAQSGTVYYTVTAFAVNTAFGSTNFTGSANTQADTVANRTYEFSFASGTVINNTHFLAACQVAPTGAHVGGYNANFSISYRLIG